jgi:AraC-like DNA-binding protein
MAKKTPEWIKTLLRIMLITAPLILSIPTIIYIFDNRLLIFPHPGYTNQIEAFTSPSSSIEDFRVESKKITFSYILKEEPGGLYIPYSSIVIWLTRENTFFDLSSYDFLILNIEKATAGKIVVFIKTFENGISKPDKQEGITLRHNEYTLSLTEGVTTYRIDIKNFFTPDWWFDLMHIPWNKRIKETYKKVSALDLQFIHRSTDQLEEKKELFIIKKIAFHKSYPVIYIILNIATALYCIVIGSVIFSKRKKITSLRIPGQGKEDKIPQIKKIQYKQLEFQNYADIELKRIMDYLKEHYQDPKISSTLISRATGIPRSHITELIKNQYGCTCKKLINHLRITEAKRLLKTTDRLILEIALKVGFNDISTFNRWFKQEEGKSPRQYRSESPF